MQNQSTITQITSNSVATYAMNTNDFNTLNHGTAKKEYDIPKQLLNSTQERKKEFIAGRLCAQKALVTIADSNLAPIGFNSDRSPKWPKGYIGSITHSEGFVSAAVASKETVQGVGIDSEAVFSTKIALELEDVVLSKKERKLYNRKLQNHYSYEEFVTIIYSAKESIYKCTNPIFDEFLDFSDIVITEVNPRLSRIKFKFYRSVTFKNQINQPLTVNFTIDNMFVFTSFELAN